MSRAWEVVRSLLEPTPVETRPVGQALGLVCARTVAAPLDVAPFASSSMDGWAVSSNDTDPFPSLGHIATGAPLPDGADAVVPWEEGTEEASGVRVSAPVKAGQHVRAAGEDTTRGTELARPGEILTPTHLGVLPSAGVAHVDVHREVRVAVVITGEELVPPGAPLGQGQIYDVNSVLLPNLLRSAGAHIVSTRQVGDDLTEITRALTEAAANTDLVVTTGGASVGKRDWVRTAVRSSGDVAVWRVAMRPGKPFGAGRLADKPILMLPGNPGSVVACCHAFVTPALRVLAGCSQVAHRRLPGRLTNSVSNAGDREYLAPACLNDDHVTVVEGRSSQGISHLRATNGFVRVAPDTNLTAGTFVEIELTV